MLHEWEIEQTYKNKILKTNLPVQQKVDEKEPKSNKIKGKIKHLKPRG